jgi:hypothetical protein
MTPNELEAAVRNSLNYLIEEGLVVQIGNKYRLKTQRELDQELQNLLTD